jgi:hypothetical protein
MINSSVRKLALTGWLIENEPDLYRSSLKFQKFLFFCEALCFAGGAPHEFSGLKGYRKGPVFGAAWGDRASDADEFRLAALSSYRNAGLPADEDIVRLAAFVCKSFTEDELSRVTHLLDMWKAKEGDIEAGMRHVDLDVSDFSENDALVVNEFRLFFPPGFVNNQKVVNVGGTNYVFPSEDAAKLTSVHMSELEKLDSLGELENPVYSRLDESGVILVD